jgi:hypothetical protein
MALRRPAPAHWLPLLALLVGSVASLAVPHPRWEQSARAAGFSVERALAELRVMAAEPRPPGSPAHAAVHDHIVRRLRELNVEVSEQDSSSFVQMGGYSLGTRVRNVLARIPGREPQARAILLAAHYDSVPNSPAASDDGASVAALLETARVLASGPRLRRDVYLLFDDGEELGMHGARAFVHENPAARRVGLALNFEARGTRGPMLLFQTSPEDGELVREFARGADWPSANSLFSTLSGILPNDTDAIVFVPAGWSVLSFALAEGLEHYHRFTDTVDELDPASLAHIGCCALAVGRHFANLERLPVRHGQAVYFDLWGRWLVTYTAGWAALLGTLCALGWVLLVLARQRDRSVTRQGLVRGLKTQGWLLALAVVVPLGLDVARRPLVDEFSWIQRTPVVGLGALAVVAGSSVLLYARGLAEAQARELVLGGMAVPALLALLLGWLEPAASALWQWAVLAALVAWALEAPRAGRSPWVPSALVAAAVGMAALLVVPVVAAAFALSGPILSALPVLMAATNAALMVAPALPARGAAIRRAGLALIAAGVCVVVAVTVFDGIRGPTSRVDSLAYALNADTGAAQYVTEDSTIDPWVGRIIPAQAKAASMPGFFRDPTPRRQTKAEAIELLPPQVRVRPVHHDGRSRTVELWIQAESAASCLELWQTDGPKVENVTANGRTLYPIVRYSPEFDAALFRLFSGDRSTPGQNLLCCGLGDRPLSLVLRVHGAAPARLRLVESSTSLPDSVRRMLPKRPTGLGPRTLSDRTLVSQTVVL